jgi:nucleotide-binding universal stress UspA family protein
MDASRDRRPVVVGVDPSYSARDAAEWAADLAAVWGAPLHLVHVVPGATDDAPITPVPGWLTELRDAAERAGADPDDTEVLPGATVEVLAAHAAGARMLVLGSYGDGAWCGMLAGPLALALIGRAPCPVAVVRGSAPQVPPPRSGPVVVGVDGSPAGHSALTFAAALAAAVGARLVAVHTVSDVVPGPHGGARRRSEPPEVLAAEGAGALDAQLELVAAAHPELPVERVMVGDTPVRALMNRAEGARLLVVGRRGHREETGMLLGSTSRALVEFAPCPVVVTRPVGVPDGAAPADQTAAPATP